MRTSVELAAKKTTAASVIAGRSETWRSSPRPRSVPPTASSARPASDPRDRELGEVEDDAVGGPAAGDVRDERRDHLHGHRLGESVGEQQGEGERRGEGLLADLPVHLDREQLADQDEEGEHPELGVGGAERVAVPAIAEPEEHRGAPALTSQR